MIILGIPLLWILFILGLVSDRACAVKHASPDACGLVRTINRVDCFPEAGANQGQCQERGCCWIPQDPSEPGMPMCFFPSMYPTYETERMDKIDRGFRAILNRNQSSYIKDEFKQVRMDVTAETKTRLRLRFTFPSDPNRWEPPIPLGKIDETLQKSDFGVDISKAPFWIRVSLTSKFVIFTFFRYLFHNGSVCSDAQKETRCNSGILKCSNGSFV
ncbi:Lysosomal alpha-glucosidase [Fasciolopsis buskii]|uniref:Lysosomal alpha-glucosidase n=1 Tax=Fasciolopsis buskii TaxID=27845 RepID=A0A8E0VJK4_9TREM|nr:Lysosomal alpha-glucosidase [Fasciolopsis buski]